MGARPLVIANNFSRPIYVLSRPDTNDPEAIMFELWSDPPIQTPKDRLFRLDVGKTLELTKHAYTHYFIRNRLGEPATAQNYIDKQGRRMFVIEPAASGAN
ncbi:MAG: hypothetical protein AAB562_02180 [Patescibacteria group bacterium]